MPLVCGRKQQRRDLTAPRRRALTQPGRRGGKAWKNGGRREPGLPTAREQQQQHPLLCAGPRDAIVRWRWCNHPQAYAWAQREATAKGDVRVPGALTLQQGPDKRHHIFPPPARGWTLGEMPSALPAWGCVRKKKFDELFLSPPGPKISLSRKRAHKTRPVLRPARGSFRTSWIFHPPDHGGRIRDGRDSPGGPGGSISRESPTRFAYT